MFCEDASATNHQSLARPSVPRWQEEVIELLRIISLHNLGYARSAGAKPGYSFVLLGERAKFVLGDEFVEIVEGAITS